MLRITAFLFCLSALLATSCVNDPQDLPLPLHYQPVFYAEMQLDQETLRLAAGEDGYSMHTEHYTDVEGVTRYISSLEPDTCQVLSCPVLEFEFFDNQISGHPESGVTHTFHAGFKDYYSVEREGDVEITFFLGQDIIEPGVAYWTTGNDTTPVTTHELQFISRPNAYFDLCFHHNGVAGCSKPASYCFHSLASAPCIGVMKADRNFGEYIIIEMDVQGTPPYTYAWMNGANTSFILVPAQDGEVDVQVLVTDATSSTIEVNQTIRIDNGNAEMCGGSPLFVYSIAREPFSQFSTAIVRYTGDDGKVFSSAYGDQTASTFEILEVSDFEDNPDGFKTKHIVLRMSGTLYTADGAESISFDGHEVSIAISYSP